MNFNSENSGFGARLNVIDMKTYLEVSAIENGTVIDHIPSHSLLKVMKVLGLEDNTTNRITLGSNLESKRIEKKAIIKVADMFVSEHKINEIAIFAPAARVSYIENFIVKKKFKVTVPDSFEGIIKCANPACVTNQEREIETRFELVNKFNIALRCCYCEKITLQEQFQIK